MTQLDRIEAKLDHLIEALADEGEEESDTVEVRALDGSTTQVPRGASHRLLRNIIKQGELTCERNIAPRPANLT